MTGQVVGQDRENNQQREQMKGTHITGGRRGQGSPTEGEERAGKLISEETMGRRWSDTQPSAGWGGGAGRVNPSVRWEKDGGRERANYVVHQPANRSALVAISQPPRVSRFVTASTRCLSVRDRQYRVSVGS